MAVTVVQEQSPWKTAGSLMTLAGLGIPDAGLLAPLGMGISTATGGMDNQQNTVFEKILDNVMSGKGNEWMSAPQWMKPGKKQQGKTGGI